MKLILQCLTISDLQVLEVSLCNHSDSEVLLNSIRNNITIDNISVDSIKVNDLLTWIGKRGINVTNISNSYINDTGLVGLSKHCHALESLNITRCKKLTCNETSDLANYHWTPAPSIPSSKPSIIIELANHCWKSLRVRGIDLSKVDGITELGMLEIIHCCPQIQQLLISSCDISDNSIMEISRHCTNLQSLSIGTWGGDNKSNINESSIIKLVENCTRLQSLDIRLG